MWPCGHHHCQNGWLASETSTVRKPCASAPGSEPGRCTCSSFNRSRSNPIDPFEPLISNVIPFLRPRQKREASIVPTAPPLKSTTASTASSTSTVPPGLFLMNVLVAPLTGAGDLPVEPPHLRERGVGDPFLQVAAAKMVDLPEIARLEHLASKAHGRHEPVVERAHVLDAGLRHPLPDVIAFLGIAAERLFAHDMLASLGRRDRRRRM